jgi:hypothetical protein
MVRQPPARSRHGQPQAGPRRDPPALADPTVPFRRTFAVDPISPGGTRMAGPALRRLRTHDHPGLLMPRDLDFAGSTALAWGNRRGRVHERRAGVP